MAFYYRLARYAERMVRPPNRYTFKKHYIMRLLKGIFNYLLGKEVTAEHSRMESILHHTRRAEEEINQTVMWYDTRHTNMNTCQKRRRQMTPNIRNH